MQQAHFASQRHNRSSEFSLDCCSLKSLMSVTSRGLFSSHILWLSSSASLQLLSSEKPFTGTPAVFKHNSKRQHRGRSAMADAGGAKAVNVPSTISFATGNANKLKEVPDIPQYCQANAHAH